MADKLVDLGLAKLGYEYLCVDGEQTLLLVTTACSEQTLPYSLGCVGLPPLAARSLRRTDAPVTTWTLQMPGQNPNETTKGTRWPTKPPSQAA